jgi:hypothetical protein
VNRVSGSVGSNPTPSASFRLCLCRRWGGPLEGSEGGEGKPQYYELNLG